ncbi:helix-turn-helix domain-containing protein [Candidatus Enterococcus ikei]|uniref:Helix-turn-helix transcriptional regulator n=1 Tax=Candidatus Enterococcus ikei TaxID=2815326 RepID=A0ABS3GXI5_9ENTE|nr:helix-turn-helix transcriptional regulator [Enterococcus sp. DIV0869a]MBO0439613.1 helix-turn-helix transcriptional regulator [Enterococcus sp. DIV0869a]
MHESELKRFISKKLSYFRSRKNVSAREMSLAIGQSDNYINSIENERVTPSIQMLYVICDYLDVTVEEFLRETRSKEYYLKEINKRLMGYESEQLEHILLMLKSF